MKRTWLVLPLLALWAGAPALLTSCGTPGEGPSTQAAVRPYPLNYCLVSGDKIGEMGDPVKTVYKGQEFKFCCKDCVKDFNKDPDKYMQELAESEQKAK
jgi:YHS domain-containing protein